MLAMIGQKPMFYQSIKHRKSVFYCFSPQHPLSKFLLDIAENIFFEEIYDGGLCEAFPCITINVKLFPSCLTLLIATELVFQKSLASVTLVRLDH